MYETALISVCFENIFRLFFYCRSMRLRKSNATRLPGNTWTGKCAIEFNCNFHSSVFENLQAASYCLRADIATIIL